MNLTIACCGSHLVVRVLDPRLDAAIALEFKDRMRQIISQGTQTILLDMGAIGFMDSSGLGAVIAMHKAMPAGRRLELARLTPNVARVFRLTHMDSVFAIHDDLPPQSDPAQNDPAQNEPAANAPTEPAPPLPGRTRGERA